MASVIRFFCLLGLFVSLFSSTAFAAVIERQLADGECVSVVVWEATRDASLWQNDVVHVLHPTEDVEYPKDGYTMRHLPIGARVRIHEPSPLVDAVPATASTMGAVESSFKVSTDEPVYQSTARLSLASFSPQAASAVPSYGTNVVPTASQNYQYPEHHIPLEGWLLIIPCMVGLLVCAVHGINVWRERRELRRSMRRPFPVVRGDPVLPGGVQDIDLSSLDVRLAEPPPKTVAHRPVDDFELTFPPLEQGFEVRPPRPPTLN